MSTAYHPQTDGQTEQANRVVTEMLRAYVTARQNDWDQHLAMVLFACNSADQESTGYSPFYLNYGQHPLTPLSMSVPTSDTPRSAADFARRMHDLLQQARTNVKAAQERQARYDNRHRRAYQFHVGDRVLLQGSFVKNLRSQRGVIAGATAKLQLLNWGPFRVLEVVSPNAVRLEFPEQWAVHSVVNTSFVLPYRDDEGQYPARREEVTPKLIEGEEHFHVEAFLNHRYLNSYLQYYVQYKGQGPERNEWSFAADLMEDMDQGSFDRLEQHYCEQHNVPELSLRRFRTSPNPTSQAPTRRSTRLSKRFHE
jgi:hypothetical protein